MAWAEFFGRLLGKVLVADSFVSLNHQLEKEKFPVKRAFEALNVIENKPKSKTAIGVLKNIFSSYKTPKGITRDLQEKINNLRKKALDECNEFREARIDKDFRRVTTLIQKVKDIIGPTS